MSGDGLCHGTEALISGVVSSSRGVCGVVGRDKCVVVVVVVVVVVCGGGMAAALPSGRVLLCHKKDSVQHTCDAWHSSPTRSRLPRRFWQTSRPLVKSLTNHFFQ